MYQILPSNLFYPFLAIFFSILSVTSLMNFYMTMNMSAKSEKLKKSDKKVNLKTPILSLFMSFDPHSSINLLGFNELNWLTNILFVSLMFYSFWMLPSRMILLTKFLLMKLCHQFLIALKSKKDGSMVTFCTIFVILMFCNLLGLIPYVFTPSSQLTFNLMFSVPMWTGFFLYGWFLYSKKMFAHLVPLSTPLPLISFMVLIELISTMIRPSTLSIRLMANMVSGHLLFTLIGNSFTSSTLSSFFILMMIQTLLSLLEIGVSLIQAYVFCILLTLYSDESDYKSDSYK